jgi:hypothetical protein
MLQPPLTMQEDLEYPLTCLREEMVAATRLARLVEAGEGLADAKEL